MHAGRSGHSYECPLRLLQRRVDFVRCEFSSQWLSMMLDQSFCRELGEMRIVQRRWSWAAWFASVAILAFIGSTARATLVAPGQSVGDGTPQSPGSLTLFADALGTRLALVDTPVSTPTYNGTLASAAYLNPGGTLDFLFQFVNSPTSRDGIERLAMTNFTGFTTDVGYRTDFAGAQPPLFATRNSSGSVVGFEFSSTNQPGPYLISPGEASRAVVIRTNATQFFAGNTAIIDGFAANAPSFAPAEVPEPASIAGIATLSLSAIMRRRRS